MLDILVYTDSRESESLNGRTGFQFIASSPGATPSDEAPVREGMQHLSWSELGKNEWEQHPPTCAYRTIEGRFYLSRGISTGDTIGGRPGNQLTVTLMTSDPYDILPLRPAQLFSSPSWSFERPTGTSLPAWASPVEIDPDFDIPALHQLVADDPWAAAALPTILTMLEQTQQESRVKLVIVHPDQTLVMRWIALLSRFLDAEAALALEFWVYRHDFLSAPAQIVGAHPLFAPGFGVPEGTTRGVNVLDLVERAHSNVEPSESARRFARWFLGGDPYEALDAIEVSSRWSRVMDAPTAAHAAELATMVSSRGPVDRSQLLTTLTAIRLLAEAGRTDELEAYGDALADIVTSCAPTTADDLQAIDACAWLVQDRGDVELGQSLALAALEWVAADPPLARAWTTSTASHDPGRRLRWHDDEARAHGAALLATLLAATPTPELPEAFRLGAVLDTGVAEAAVASDIRRLAALWATTPALTAEAGSWLHGPAVVEALTSALVATFAANDTPALGVLAGGAWDWIMPGPWTLDPSRPISVWLAVRALQTPDLARRAEVLAAVQSQVPNAAWPVFLTTSFGLVPEEVIAWAQAHGSLDPALGTAVEGNLRSAMDTPAWWRGGGVKVLHAFGKGDGMPGLSAQLADLITANREVLGLFERAHAAASTVPNPALGTLEQRYADRLPILYGPWVVEAILTTADVRQATRLAARQPRLVVEHLRRELENRLKAGRPEFLAAAVRLLDEEIGEAFAEAGRAALDAVWDDKQLEATRAALLAGAEGLLDPQQQERLDDYLDNQGKGRMMRGVSRVTKSIFKKDK